MAINIYPVKRWARKRLTVGQPVRVRLNDETLNGQITNILPAVDNRLPNPPHPV